MTRILFFIVFAFIVLGVMTGCQGLGVPGNLVPTPTPTPAGSLQSVNHIIFMMQENRSFDAYFGKINDFRSSLGLGRDTDDMEVLFTNPADDGDMIQNFHLTTSCIFNTTAAWLESHGDANRFDITDSAPLL